MDLLTLLVLIYIHKCLKEAIEERKRDPEEPKRIPLEIDLDIDAYIPDTYII